VTETPSPSEPSSPEPSLPSPQPSSLVRPLPVRRPVRGRGNRAAVVFAAVGVLLAVAAMVGYLVRPSTGASSGTPEDAVREFLGAVFVGHDPARVGKVVCSGWNPDEAIARTVAGVDTDARVSWDQVSVVSTDRTHAYVRARLGLRFPDDKQPSVFHEWRFSVVDESGWRVCEARPFAS
jgi:hypothetical protein